MRNLVSGLVLILCAFAAGAQVQPRPASGNQVSSVSGNGHTIATTNGPLTPGDCDVNDANGNIIDSGQSCTGASTGNTPGTSTVFQCEEYANLTACLNAAAAYTTTSETAGLAARVVIPQGTYNLTAPYALTNGMQIEGVAPRTKYISNSYPDSNMVLNGGTVINCGAATSCFTGSNVRGISMKGLAFTNYTGAALSFGGNAVEGVAFSNFADLYAIGSTTVNGTASAWIFYNSTHIQADRLIAFDVNQGWSITQQSAVGNYGNFTVNDAYTYTYPKSAANSNNTIAGAIIQVLAPASGTPGQLNNIVLNRFQVNSFGGDGTGTNVVVAGISSANVTHLEIHDADIEGNNLYGVQVSYTNLSSFDLGTTASNTYDIQMGTAASQNVVKCNSNCKLAPGPGSYYWNSYYGQINSAPTYNSGGMVGVFTNYSTATAVVGQGSWQDQFGNAGPPITANAFINQGTTTFTSSGCSATSLVGGGSGGSFHSGTTGTCTIVITMKTDFGGGITAPNGWSCWANDLTTTTDTVKQTVSTTTAATLAGTTASGDVVNFGCMAY